MVKSFQLATALIISMALCAGVAAQRRGGVASAHISSARSAPMAPAFAANPRTTPRTNFAMTQLGNRTTSGIPYANSYTRYSGVRTATGANFTRAPYAATATTGGCVPSGGCRYNSPESRRGARAGQTSFAPILITGYPFYFTDYYGDWLDYNAPQYQSQAYVDQEPAAVEYAPQDAGPTPDYTIQPAAVATTTPAVATRDTDSLILVERDGQILFASVFSINGNQVQYVTPDGVRRSLPVTQLDVDATQQMNEARGTTLQLHN